MLEGEYVFEVDGETISALAGSSIYVSQRDRPTASRM